MATNVDIDSTACVRVCRDPGRTPHARIHIRVLTAHSNAGGRTQTRFGRKLPRHARLAFSLSLRCAAIRPSLPRDVGAHPRACNATAVPSHAPLARHRVAPRFTARPRVDAPPTNGALTPPSLSLR